MVNRVIFVDVITTKRRIQDFLDGRREPTLGGERGSYHPFIQPKMRVRCRISIVLLQTSLYLIKGGSKGGARDAPPRGPNSFNFMQFLGKFGKIICWRPPGSWRPLLGEILDEKWDVLTQLPCRTCCEID